MKVESLDNIIGFDFFAGVLDSQLKVLCNYLIDRYVINAKHHIIAANEGNCTAIVVGYHFATAKVPMFICRIQAKGTSSSLWGAS